MINREITSEDSGALGPGTDLIISLVAILVMMLAINSEKLREAISKAKDYDAIQQELLTLKEREAEMERLEAIEKQFLKEQEVLKRIKANQNELVAEIEKKYGRKAIHVMDNHFAFRFGNNTNYDIQIINDFHQQRITFGSNVLFDPDQIFIKSKGRVLLQKMGGAIKSKISFIGEIQIQGHADINKTRRHGSNLKLASKRAIAVYQLFTNNILINPAEELISVTSFGEFKPVSRSAENIDFNYQKLKVANSTDEQRKINRRIEIILNYRK